MNWKRIPLGMGLIGLCICTEARAQALQFLCTNTEGRPNHILVDFDKKTATDISLDSTAMPAVISKQWIRWTDPVDEMKFTIKRATNALEARSQGHVIYKKQCKMSAA